jgi:hypothetical protein
MAVWCAHHGSLDALVAESSDSPRPLSFDQGLPFELEAELLKELYRRCEVLDNDTHVVHPFKCHAPNLRPPTSGVLEGELYGHVTPGMRSNAAVRFGSLLTTAGTLVAAATIEKLWLRAQALSTRNSTTFSAAASN